MAEEETSNERMFFRVTGPPVAVLGKKTVAWEYDINDIEKSSEVEPE